MMNVNTIIIDLYIYTHIKINDDCVDIHGLLVHGEAYENTVGGLIMIHKLMSFIRTTQYVSLNEDE